MDDPLPPWVRTARRTLVALAIVGILLCLWVTQAWWGDWPDHPGGLDVALNLGILAGATALILPLALLGPRLLGVPAALALLLWGWMGTWAYGFLWVPGAAAVLGCFLPRPPQAMRPTDADSAPST